MDNKIYTAIGFMSGTSLDGVDVARVMTDGRDFVRRMESAFFPYDEQTRQKIRASLGIADRDDPRVVLAEQLVTDAHIDAFKKFGQSADLIGFHGQTSFHDPANRLTIQLGDGAALAQATGIDTVYDFRSADVAAGGQGAPFLPLYHRVLATSSAAALPCAIVNIGGVGNITFIGRGAEEIIAFDTGPGNALLDDWMLAKTGRAFDDNGQLAGSGRVDETLLQQFLQHPYFALSTPKSLDREDFTKQAAAILSSDLSPEDGAATLVAFTVAAIQQSFAHLPAMPSALYVTGGGRHNGCMMRVLSEQTGLPVHSVDALGWNGDSVEAEGFAYLAVRSVLGLPLSLPTTTGVPTPLTGGQLVRRDSL